MNKKLSLIAVAAGFALVVSGCSSTPDSKNDNSAEDTAGQENYAVSSYPEDIPENCGELIELSTATIAKLDEKANSDFVIQDGLQFELENGDWLLHATVSDGESATNVGFIGYGYENEKFTDFLGVTGSARGLYGWGDEYASNSDVIADAAKIWEAQAGCFFSDLPEFIEEPSGESEIDENIVAEEEVAEVQE